MNTEKVIYIAGNPIPVTEEVYYAYHRMKRREKTLVEKDMRNRLVYYDAWDTGSFVGRDAVPDSGSPTPEDAVIAEVTRDKLNRCLALLTESERDLICAIFFDGVKLSVLSRELGIPYRTLGCRRDRILEKLRRMMK